MSDPKGYLKVSEDIRHLHRLPERKGMSEESNPQTRLLDAMHERTQRCLGGNHLNCAKVEQWHREGNHNLCLPVEDGASEPPACAARTTGPEGEQYECSLAQGHDDVHEAWLGGKVGEAQDVAFWNDGWLRTGESVDERRRPSCGLTVESLMGSRFTCTLMQDHKGWHEDGNTQGPTRWTSNAFLPGFGAPPKVIGSDDPIKRIQALPEAEATKSRDYGRGYAQAIRDVLEILDPTRPSK